MPSKQVETRVIVEASPARVYEVLSDLANYPSWNRVLKLSIKGELRAGVRARLSVKGSPLPIPVRFEVVDPGRELRWTGGPPFILRGSHYFELHGIPGETDRTEVIHAEEFSGVLVPLMWPVMLPQLQRLYTAINEGLAEHLTRG